MEKSGSKRCTVIAWLTLPFWPVIVMGKSPPGLVVLVCIVSVVSEVESGRLAVTPLGSPEGGRKWMAPVKVPLRVILIVTEPEAPCWMIREGGSSAADRLSYGFRLATARKPSAPELDILIGTLKGYEDRYQTRPADAGKFLAHGERPHGRGIPEYDLAAYTAVGSIILNLDETITKE